MTIFVTQGHINSGQREVCSLCPAALAIKDATGAKYVSVYPGAIYVAGVRYQTPLAVRDFIDRFDKGKYVAPFSFDLDVQP